MTITRVTRLVFGALIVLSLLLGLEASPLFHSAVWLWLSAVVGTALCVGGLTGWCLIDCALRLCGMGDAKKELKRPGQRF